MWDAQGDLSSAMTAYTDSNVISDRLAKSDASNAVWQRDLAMGLVRMGSIHGKLGDREKANVALQQAQEILKWRQQNSPDNPQLICNIALF